jgi:flagellar FliL protein
MADDKQDNTDIEVAESGGGSKKKLVIIAAGVLVLLLVSGAAAFLLLGGDEDAGGRETGAEAEQAFVGEPTYHKLDPVFVVNLPPGGRAKMLQVGLQVFTRDPSLVDALAQHAPMLRHHLFDVLSSQQADDLYERPGRERLQKALEEKLREQLSAVGVHEPRIDAVYFTQFVLQ